MTQTCPRCSRINPTDALYCYHDGGVLGNGARGPLRTGTQPFVHDFVFPSGRACRNFDELVLACHEEWPQALSLLEKGYLEQFLGGLGRVDLAQAAKEAAGFPDRDRGLDQFLGKLPTDVVERAKLQVEPRQVNLGLIQVGEDRAFDLSLSNQGMRLLYGSVTCADCVWLALGEGQGASEKLFQTTSEVTLRVHVRGQHLRAGSQPLEGRLLVESNGGTVEVAVRAEVPVKPFPEGLLAGARTPRQIAEKAKAAPKEAALLFEKGAVADWYRSNGWKYPVRGPAALGVGAVQQFFEALGLTPPPKVEISHKSVELQGAVGQELRTVLKVETQEKRPVYAHASSNQAWLEVGRSQLSGRTALIRLVVPAVPDRNGETLRAKVTVTANGNQRFVVPVTLTVEGALEFEETLTFDEPAAPPPAPAALVTVPAPARLAAAPPPPPKPKPKPKTGPKPPRTSTKHLLPALALLLALGGVAGWDVFSKSWHTLPDNEALVAVNFNLEMMTFGLTMPREGDPNDSKDPKKRKRLTYAFDGDTNNTCVKIGDAEYLFGLSPGHWARDGDRFLKRQELVKDRKWSSAVDYPERVRVTQQVEIIRNEQTGLLDTCLIRYTAENMSNLPNSVGLRVMLDTFIGDNDGVPFVIPGQPGLLDTKQQFDEKDIPDFIQALEFGDLQNPGTVAQMGLKIGRSSSDELEFDPIDSMVICRWPGRRKKWSWPPEALNYPPQKKDSCVVLYWEPRQLGPTEKREMAFTYGLGTLSGAGSGRLALTGFGAFRPSGTFTVVAYVKNAEPGQAVTLRLPEGLTFAKGETGQKSVEPQKDKEMSQVSWRVQALKIGDYVLDAEFAGLAREKYNVRIRDRGILD